MWYVIVVLVCLFAGGYGGYEFGRAAEAKVWAVASALKQAAADVKKGL